jgi:ABC-2 type transport system permease protein
MTLGHNPAHADGLAGLVRRRDRQQPAGGSDLPTGGVVPCAGDHGGFVGNEPLLVVSMLVGAGFALALSLLVGSMLQTTGAAGAVVSLDTFAFIVSAIVIPLAPYLGGATPIMQLIKALPTYYIAEGAYTATRSQGSFSGHLHDVGVTLGSTIVALLLMAWVLRRQAAVTGAI